MIISPPVSQRMQAHARQTPPGSGSELAQRSYAASPSSASARRESAEAALEGIRSSISSLRHSAAEMQEELVCLRSIASRSTNSNRRSSPGDGGLTHPQMQAFSGHDDPCPLTVIEMVASEVGSSTDVTTSPRRASLDPQPNQDACIASCEPRSSTVVPTDPPQSNQRDTSRRHRVHRKERHGERIQQLEERKAEAQRRIEAASAALRTTHTTQAEPRPGVATPRRSVDAAENTLRLSATDGTNDDASMRKPPVFGLDAAEELVARHVEAMQVEEDALRDAVLRARRRADEVYLERLADTASATLSMDPASLTDTARNTRPSSPAVAAPTAVLFPK